MNNKYLRWFIKAIKFIAIAMILVVLVHVIIIAVAVLFYDALIFKTKKLGHTEMI